MIEQDANSMISACGILGADGLEHVAVFLQAMLMMELELETLKAHVEILAKQIRQRGHENIVRGDVERRMEGDIAF